MIERILYIEASPKGDASTSTRLARQCLRDIEQRLPAVTIDHWPIWSEPLPEVDAGFLRAKHAMLSGAPMSLAEGALWAQVVALVDRLKSADALVLSTPIWNFSIPYRLKHLIDVVTQAGLTFSFSPDTGYRPLLEDRPTIVVVSSAGDYSNGPCHGQPDLATPYLRSALGFLGLHDVAFAAAGPSAAPPDVVRGGVEQAAAALARASARLVGGIA